MEQSAPSAVPPPEEVRHYAFIDALRGLAFLTVLLVHVRGSAHLPVWLRSVQQAGNYGVQLFFVVSALTLFMSCESRRTRDRHPSAAFFLRRFFRIAPMFWLAMAGCIAYDAWASRPDTAAQILSTATFLHGWHPSTINAVVPGGWSIAVEMNFYLMVPFCFRHLRSLGRAVAVGAAVLVVSLAVGAVANRLLVRATPPGAERQIHDFLYFWLPRQLPVFFLGFILHFLMRRVREAARPPWGPGLLVGSLALIGALVAVGHRLPLTYLLYSVAFVLLALALSLYPTAILVNPVTRFAGKVSYSGYLTHIAVLRSLEMLLTRAKLAPAYDAHPVAGFVLFSLVGAAATLAVSALAYYAVEVPGQNLGKALIRRIGAVPAEKAPAAA